MTSEESVNTETLESANSHEILFGDFCKVETRLWKQRAR